MLGFVYGSGRWAGELRAHACTCTRKAGTAGARPLWPSPAAPHYAYLPLPHRALPCRARPFLGARVRRRVETARQVARRGARPKSEKSEVRGFVFSRCSWAIPRLLNSDAKLFASCRFVCAATAFIPGAIVFSRCSTSSSFPASRRISACCRQGASSTTTQSTA